MKQVPRAVLWINSPGGLWVMDSYLLLQTLRFHLAILGSNFIFIFLFRTKFVSVIVAYVDGIRHIIFPPPNWLCIPLWVHVLELHAEMAKKEGTVSPIFWNR